MRILLFLNNWGGWKVARFLKGRGEAIVGAFLQPPDDRRFAEQSLAALQLPPDRIWTSDQLKNPDTLEQMRALKPDLGISAFFGRIFKPPVLEMFPRGVINLHSAYLPYNRGWHTNVWPIIEGTPAGATIHYLDPGVDTGDIIVQRQFTVDPTDTAGTLHERITRGLVGLFEEAWPGIRSGTNGRTAQDHSKATSHRKAQIADISFLKLDERRSAGDLINVLRARTYPPYPAAFYTEADRKRYVRIDVRSAGGGTDGTPVDLQREYSVKELLDLLLSPQGVRFDHPRGRFHARAHHVLEQDINTQASPHWMT